MNKNKKIIDKPVHLDLLGTNLLFALMKQNVDIAVIARHDNLMFR